MESDTDKLLKSVIETLIKKEAPKFKSLIQKELASRIHSKIEELKKALSGSIVTGVEDKKKEEKPVALPENLPGAPSAPPAATPKENPNTTSDVPSPEQQKKEAEKAAEQQKKATESLAKAFKKSGDLKIVPTAAGSAKDDISLDPNFEKEFYHSSQKYKDQEIVMKQLGTGFAKPVRVYINGRRWEFFPGPKAAMKASKEYIDQMMKDVSNDPNLAVGMTMQIYQDKQSGIAQVSAPVDAGKPNEVADANLKKKALETGNYNFKK
jgi:uncharacterized protein (UPF0147 family)